MYKSAALLFSTLLLASCGNKDNNGGFELKGNFSNGKGEMLYLEKLSAEQPVVIDSVALDENGDFEFQNYSPKIGFYRIRVTPQNFAMLVLDSADKVKVSGNITDLGNTYKVEGSEETTLFLRYNEMSKSRDLRLDSLNKAFQSIMETSKMDAARMDSVSRLFEAPYNAIVNSANEEMIEKLKKNTEMYASLMAIQALDPDRYADIYKAVDQGLIKKYPNERNVKMFHNVVLSMLSTAIGQPAPEIELETPEGKELALSSLKGKVVLIDFWASWCGPCRKEMPNVVKAYAKFKNKGFEIFGVSLDQDKARWIEAIQKDGITWPQVSDLKQWQSSVVRQYNIQGIPYTVLLDREGNILAKNLRGEELEKKLTEVLR
jgi:peroxiredoxin